jgi:hypothetical protein
MLSTHAKFWLRENRNQISLLPSNQKVLWRNTTACHIICSLMSASFCSSAFHHYMNPLPPEPQVSNNILGSSAIFKPGAWRFCDPSIFSRKEDIQDYMFFLFKTLPREHVFSKVGFPYNCGVSLYLYLSANAAKSDWLGEEGTTKESVRLVNAFHQARYLRLIYKLSYRFL